MEDCDSEQKLAAVYADVPEPEPYVDVQQKPFDDVDLANCVKVQATRSKLETIGSSLRYAHPLFHDSFDSRSAEPQCRWSRAPCHEVAVTRLMEGYLLGQTC